MSYYYNHETSELLGMISLLLWFFCCIITSFFWLFAKVLSLLYELVQLALGPWPGPRPGVCRAGPPPARAWWGGGG